MAEWNIYLEFTKGGSSKFWRGKVDGTEVTTNWGRIGTSGQSKVKDMGSAESALSQLQSQAAGKRKKGYLDATTEASEPEPAPVAKEETWTASMKLAESGRTIALTLACDGKVIQTSVRETYESPDAAAAAYTRIKQKLIEDGYSE